MGNTKWVHLTFAICGLLAAYTVGLTVEWIWGAFAKPKDLYTIPIALIVASLGTYWYWRQEKHFTKVSDICNELMKVTWPTRDETGRGTVVVSITVVIFSAFLGLFDLVWSWATGIIYAS